MSSSVHWATHYIGLPWHAGARGPEAFDCWGLFLAIQRDHFGRELPEIPELLLHGWRVEGFYRFVENQ